MNNDPKKFFERYPWLYEYSCYECGAVMEIIGEVLVCPECGHSVDLEDWITEPEDYEEYYPTREEMIGKEDNKEQDGE